MAITCAPQNHPASARSPARSARARARISTNAESPATRSTSPAARDGPATSARGALATATRPLDAPSQSSHRGSMVETTAATAMTITVKLKGNATTRTTAGSRDSASDATASHTSTMLPRTKKWALATAPSARLTPIQRSSPAAVPGSAGASARLSNAAATPSNTSSRSPTPDTASRVKSPGDSPHARLRRPARSGPGTPTALTRRDSGERGTPAEPARLAPAPGRSARVRR